MVPVRMLLILHIRQCKQIFYSIKGKGSNVNFSDACSIPDGHSVLLTGGNCYMFGFDHWTWMPTCPCSCGFELLEGDVCDWHTLGCSRVASSKVHRYTRDQGWVEDLPNMAMGRHGHGCAAFTMDQEQVR